MQACLFSEKLKLAHLRAFVVLSLIRRDRFILDKSLYSDLAKKLKVSERTARAYFNSLLEENWLGFNIQTNVVFIRSRFKIGGLYSSSRHYVLIKESGLKNINEIVLAAMVAYSVKFCIRSYKENCLPELINGGSIQGSGKMGRIAKGYAPVAVKYLSKVMNRSPSWVDRVKQSAIKKRLIRRRHDFKDTNVIWAERLAYFVANPSEKGRAVKKYGKLCLVGVDLLKPAVIYLRKRKFVRT
jgi:hypothetical protein